MKKKMDKFPRRNVIFRKIIYFNIFVFALLLNFKVVESKETGNKIFPNPDHIVIVILENHSFKSIIGSKSAPYINRLAKNGALFTESYGLTHPSQPNYIMLFSGSSQGVIDDGVPQNTPFNTENLGSSLLKKGYSFTGYSEDLPFVGFTGGYYGNYARKHSPWVNWQGNCNNCIPGELNQPFNSFHSDFTKLPTVSFVIPNLVNDMHDGYGDKRISKADTWIKKNLRNYVRWTEDHNSLLIITFDEDDFSQNNKIATIFYGQPVKQGKYSEKITHYNVLRTLEDMYKLPYAGASAKVNAITDCWKKINY